MDSGKDLIKKYDLDKKEIQKWAKKKYPTFQDNLRLMVMTYVTEKMGMKIDPFEVGLERELELTPVSDLREDAFSEIEVLVVTKVSEFEYLSCPECRKKVDEDNECPSHGKVEPEVSVWRKFIAGDATGDLVLTISPGTVLNGSIVGRAVRARGSLRSDRGEFVIRTLKISDSVMKLEAEENEGKELDISEEELDTFKKFVRVYGGVPKKQLQSWHETKGLKGSLDDLIKSAGLKVKDGRYYVKED